MHRATAVCVATGALMMLMLVHLCSGQTSIKFATVGRFTSLNTTGCSLDANNQPTSCYKTTCSPLAGDPTCASLGLPNCKDGSFQCPSSAPACCQAQARWGGVIPNEDVLQAITPVSQQSGVGFSGESQTTSIDSNAPPSSTQLTADLTQPFRIGTFTHYNFPISLAPAVGIYGWTAMPSATLTLNFNNVVINTVTQNPIVLNFPLSFDETLNSGAGGRGCEWTSVKVSRTNPADTIPNILGWKNDTTGLPISGGSLGCQADASYTCQCADRVLVSSSSLEQNVVIPIGPYRYTISIVGFSNTPTYSPSNTFNTFVSQEGRFTVKYLFAKLDIVCAACPGNQKVVSNVDCNCTCPAGTAQSAADCLNVDYVYNPTNCNCSLGNNQCTNQLAQLSPPLNANCEVKTCTNGVLTVSPRATTTIIPCTGTLGGTSATNACLYRCGQTQGSNPPRYTCSPNQVTCSTVNDTFCRTNQCQSGTGVCQQANSGATAECQTYNTTTCTTYKCSGGTSSCQGTPLTCTLPRVPRLVAGNAKCTCECPTAQSCQLDFVYDTTTCSCKPSGNCAAQIAALVPALYDTCESAVCTASVLSITVKTGSTCSGTAGNLCNSRCYTDTGRGKCNSTVVVCPALVNQPCKLNQCNTATGGCVANNVAANTNCTLSNPTNTCKQPKCIVVGSTLTCSEINPCPGNQQPNVSNACACGCPAGTPTSCPTDQFLDTTSCSCTPTGNCNGQFQALNPPYDAQCETYTCQGGTTLVVSAINGNGAACQGTTNNNLCNHRCVNNAGPRNGATCTAVPVVCPTTGAPCVSWACNNKTTCDSTNTNSPCTNGCFQGTCSGGSCPSGNPCQGNQTTDASCVCACRAGAPGVLATSAAGCPSDYVFHPTGCYCYPSGNCNAQIAAQKPDPNCETYTCINSALVITPKTNGALCAGQTDLCSSRCATIAGRSTCNTTDVTCPSNSGLDGGSGCQEYVCTSATGSCDVLKHPNTDGCTLSAPNACYPRSCNSTANCVAPNPCGAKKNMNAQCQCVCTSGNTTAATCPIDYTWNEADCSCFPSGACTEQIKALNPPLDNGGCETASCSASSVLTIVSSADGAACDGLSLCVARCRPRAPARSGSAGAGATCNHDQVICQDTTACTEYYCDETDGTCHSSTKAEGVDCIPGPDPAGCTTYTCDATATCVGTSQCTVQLSPDEARCRSYSCDNETSQCEFESLDGVVNCSSSPCSADSFCKDGQCRNILVDCTSQQAVDMGLPGALLGGSPCLGLECRVNETTGVGYCAVAYKVDAGTSCQTDKECVINAKCDSVGNCVGDDDPDCDKNKADHRKEIIGGAVAGSVLSVVGAGSVLMAAAGAGVLVWQIRRRKLLNFETWDAGTMEAAVVSPLYVPNQNAHVNPLADL